jgi:hypothetical protein
VAFSDAPQKARPCQMTEGKSRPPSDPWEADVLSQVKSNSLSSAIVLEFQSRLANTDPSSDFVQKFCPILIKAILSHAAAKTDGTEQNQILRSVLLLFASTITDPETSFSLECRRIIYDGSSPFYDGTADPRYRSNLNHFLQTGVVTTLISFFRSDSVLPFPEFASIVNLFSKIRSFCESGAIAEFARAALQRTVVAVDSVDEKFIRTTDEKMVTQFFADLQAFFQGWKDLELVDNLAFKVTISFVVSPILPKQLIGLSMMQKQLINPATRSRKYVILSHTNILQTFLTDIHHGLVGEFAVVLRLLFEGQLIEKDLLVQFWHLIIRQDPSTINVYLKAFESLFQSLSAPKTHVLWQIMAASPAFPSQVCAFLRKIASRGTSQQNLLLYNELVKYALALKDTGKRAALIETLVELVPNDPSIGDSLFMQCFSNLTSFPEPLFVFALMKASCKCLSPEKAHDCFLRLAVKLSELDRDWMPFAVDTLLILARKKNIPPLLENEFRDFGEMTTILLSIGSSEVIRLYEKIFNDSVGFIKTDFLPPFFAEICKMGGQSPIFGNFVLLLFQRINPTAFKPGVKIADLTQLICIDCLWQVAFSILPDDTVLTFLGGLSANSLSMNDRKVFVDNCKERMTERPVLQCLYAMMQSVESLVDKKYFGLSENRYI